MENEIIPKTVKAYNALCEASRKAHLALAKAEKKYRLAEETYRAACKMYDKNWIR